MNTKTKARVDELHTQFTDLVSNLVTSDDWMAALKVAAKFHRYSFANTQLIWSQCMDRGFEPTHVAGYRKWQEMNRQVRKGEKGIMVLAPVTRKMEDKAGEEYRGLVGFRVVFVFDVSQTDGDELPELMEPTVVEGDRPQHYWAKAHEFLTAKRFTLEVTDVPGAANGFTSYRSRRVVIDHMLPGAAQFKTLIHEIAHVLLHEGSTTRERDEVEAESTAFIVCNVLGIETDTYSLPYVAGWAGDDMDLVAKTAQRVTKCAGVVLEAMEET